ncbi:MAG: endonuclease MutS2, partial [Ignavibacteriaceae bacterium]|nr:endonuclease MutS2 [Ignavibacteriaceae bacterium]
EIKDSASKLLYSIRKDIKEKSDELRRVVSKLVKKLTDEDISRENYTTLRDGRIVIPVKTEYKRQIKGIVHSESSTGHTSYIEPDSILEINNDLVSLGFAEKREIDRILRELTVRIGLSSPELLSTFNELVKLDLLFAKASFSIKIRGCFPEMDPSEPFFISQGRHPALILKNGINKTVPFNFRSSENKVFVITGPNAGGKTVFIKSIGLLALMVKYGYHIPVSEDSNFYFFEKIFVDIGDSQSIDNDLSTFSSHLSNIKGILENSDKNSLIIIDELGTGTDPEAGSAIASTVLDQLFESGGLVFCTTHLSDLKLLAEERKGFENASMAFDVAEIKPSYEFRQGIPGYSYAFEILTRLGYKNDFVERAKNFLSGESAEINSLLLDLEQKNSTLKLQLSEYAHENEKLKKLRESYERRVTELEKEKNQILKQTKNEAEELVVKANSELQELIKSIRSSSASQQDVSKANKFIGDLKAETSNLENKIFETTEKVDFKIGDAVKIKDTTTLGEIIEIKGNKALIQAGFLKLTVELKTLTLINKEDKKIAKHALTSTNYLETAAFKLDIRGERAGEIEFKVVKFLDDAYSSSLDKVEILHGKGTGALKKTVHQILKEHEWVESFNFAPVEIGGEGVTIVTLKR